MDFIPSFQFVASLAMFGLLLYVYNPIISYLNETFPTSGEYAAAMFFFWGLLVIINMVVSGIRLIMKMQERKGGY